MLTIKEPDLGTLQELLLIEILSLFKASRGHALTKEIDSIVDRIDLVSKAIKKTAKFLDNLYQ